MKKLGIVLLSSFVLLPACARKKRVESTQQKTMPTQTSVLPVLQEKVEQKPMMFAFNPSLLYKKNIPVNEEQPKSLPEILELIGHLDPDNYLPFAYHLLFHSELPNIKDKIAVCNELKKTFHNRQTNDVLDFFIQVLTENETYLAEHPLTDLQISLVNAPSVDSSDFFKEHPEISNVVWSLEELYKTGNNLLQEAVRLNNYAAVHFLLQKGASPRHLDDPRGVVLALQWADKYGYDTIAQELASTINKLNKERITLFDELLYKDSDAAQLVRKYGGKRSVELA